MDRTRQQWYTIVLTGVLYAAIGVVFALPASHVRVWRASAWGVSAAVFATQILYELFRMQSTPLRAAWHVSAASAIGGFGLAFAGFLRSVAVHAGDSHHRLMLTAMVAWPLLTGVPAFVVGFCASELLVRFRRACVRLRPSGGST